MSSTVVKDVEKVNSIVWFRNDLRAVDHSGLSHAIENSKNVIGVYCFYGLFLEPPFISKIKITFLEAKDFEIYY